jgi:hypothetical protein
MRFTKGKEKNRNKKFKIRSIKAAKDDLKFALPGNVTKGTRMRRNSSPINASQLEA